MTLWVHVYLLAWEGGIFLSHLGGVHFSPTRWIFQLMENIHWQPHEHDPDGMIALTDDHLRGHSSRLGGDVLQSSGIHINAAKNHPDVAR